MQFTITQSAAKEIMTMMTNAKFTSSYGRGGQMPLKVISTENKIVWESHTCNGNILMCTTIPTKTKSADRDVIAVDASLMNKIIKAFPKTSEVTFTTDTDNTENLFYKVLGSSIEGALVSVTDTCKKDYEGENKAIAKVILEHSALTKLLTGTMYAIDPTLEKDRKAILVGIRLDVNVNEQNVTGCGCDGFRLGLSTVAAKITGTDTTCVISHDTLKLLQQVSTKKKLPVTLTIFEDFARFEIGNVEINALLVAGEPLEWKKLLPTGFETEVQGVDRASAIETFKRGGIVGKTTEEPAILKLEIGDSGVVVSANSKNGRIQENLNLTGIKGSELSIHFQATYLIEALSAMNSDTVTMSFNTPLKGCIISDGMGKRAFILPVQVRD